MIRMKAEAVVISKPDADTNINGSDVNMNGKVILAEVMDKGYKGAGRLSGEVVLCVAEGDREKKVAETAMHILTKHIPAIKASGDSFRSEAENFFNHAYRELSILEGEYSTLSATLLYNFGDSVYIANCGKNAVYTFDGMYLTPVEFGNPDRQEEADPYLPDLAYQLISGVTPDTQILVFSNEVYEYTTDEQILEILRGAVSVKQACQQLIDQATENGATKNMTVMLENLVPVEVPTSGAAVPAQNDAADTQDVPAEEDEPDYTKPSKAPLVVLILLLILVALIAGLYFANQRYDLISNIFNKSTEPQVSTTAQTEPAANMVTIAKSSTTDAASTTAAATTTTTEPSSVRTSSTTRRNVISYETDPPYVEPTDEPTEPEPSDEPTDPEPTDEPTEVTEPEEPGENELENNDNGNEDVSPDEDR